VVRRVRQQHGGRGGALQVLHRASGGPCPVVSTTTQGLAFLGILSSLGGRSVYAVHLQQVGCCIHHQAQRD
jgi:hypothetical protein